MSADKRTVSTDALETLGQIHTKQEKRDAIHLAVLPVMASCSLLPGEDIVIKDGVAYDPSDVEARGSEVLCIVDPFLEGKVKKGQKFWAILRPRLVKSLRHVWEHPAFPEGSEEPKLETAKAVTTAQIASRQWIQDFAASVSLKYDVLMEGADSYLNHGDYLCFGGLLEGEDVPDEFWNHYEVVTGRTVPEANRGSFFTCSC